MAAYYNEIDPFAAAWLRALIAEGLIADGDVDERSIADVRAADLAGYAQCHFFAGIGGWSYALRLAGWPDDRPVWTGSCPCQPFSSAGRGHGAADSRHLWPAWVRLIGECRPVTIIGEQVASADGRAWLDAVSTDLEAHGYAVGAADLCAAGVGAPHIRQRLWFVADADGERCEGERLRVQPREPRSAGVETAGCGESGELADASLAVNARQPAFGGTLAREQSRNGVDLRSVAVSLGDADEPGLSERRSNRSLQQKTLGASEREAALRASVWADCDWLPCRDGKWRPVESGTFPLAAGISGRVVKLRGYGNSIVPQVAATFIEAYLTRDQ